MKASPWEKKDAMHEGIPIIDNHVPKSFVIEWIDADASVSPERVSSGVRSMETASDVHAGVEASEGKMPRLRGVMFEKVEAVYDENGKRSLVPTGEPEVFYPADDVLVAIGQENAFPPAHAVQRLTARSP